MKSLLVLCIVGGTLQMNSQVADGANMIPTEMVNKISQVMSSNTQNIIQQNLNIKEIKEEDKHLQ